MDRRVLAVLLHEEVGGAVDVEVGAAGQAPAGQAEGLSQKWWQGDLAPAVLPH